jgi:hypothetical protein
MRYRLAALLLFAVLPVLNVLAAPAPDPSAILEIEPPPKGTSPEKHRKDFIRGLTNPHIFLNDVWCDSEVRNFPMVARFKDARPWLAENLRVTEEKGKRRFRMTFKAGTSAEQVVILNALLSATLRASERYIKFREEGLRSYENCILDLEKRMKSSQNPQEAATYQMGIDELRSIHIPECRAEIARLKQFTVIKWAR